MPKEGRLPVNQRFFTVDELNELGLTRHMINNLVKTGHLTSFSNITYENVDYIGDISDSEATLHPYPVNNARTLYMPAKIGFDARGMSRSLVHYVIPCQPDSLQLVQIGVQTSLIYNYGPMKNNFEMVCFIFSGKGNVTIGKRFFRFMAVSFSTCRQTPSSITNVMNRIRWNLYG